MKFIGSVTILFSLLVSVVSWKFDGKISMSNKLRQLASATIAAVVLVSVPNTATAKIGEGDLPDGSMAFSKVLKYQTEWKKLADNLSSRDFKLDDNEVIGTKLFLKQLANEYYDLELLSKGITDTDKVNQAKEIAKDFRIKIREVDDEMSKGNYAKIGENYPITAKELSDFLDLLKDVPDEL